MCRGDARQPRQRRGFRCFTPASGCDAAVPESGRKGGALVVFGAGSQNFNGVYLFEGDLHGSWTDGDRYRKRDGTETLTYCRGWWLLTADASGDSCYGARVTSPAEAAPPQCGWGVKHGQDPAPFSQLFDSLEEVPLELQGAAAAESCSLQVHGAGSMEFDGIYRICGLHQGRFCYRKNGGDQTILYHMGCWLMNENGCGETAYGLRCDDPKAMPPSGAAWGFKKARAPAPSVSLHVHQEAVPMATRTRAAEPATTSLDSALHAANDQSLKEFVSPQACKVDGSSASTSASGTVNKEDGSWALVTASGTVDHEADSPRRHAVNMISRSSTFAPEPATVSAVATRTRAAPYLAAESLCAVLHMLNGQSPEESVARQICDEDGSLASTSASRTVTEAGGSAAAASASGIMNDADGFLASSGSGAVSHEADLDVEQVIDSKADGSKGSVDAPAEHQPASAAQLGPLLSKKPLQHGLVSQRLSELAKRSQGRPVRSIAIEECMPDHGLVSQRIQQHHHFINQA